MLQAKWNLRLDRFRSRIGESVKKKAERITQHLVDEFIERSPVLTGEFRASWDVSEGAPHFIRVVGGSEGSPLAAPQISVRARNSFPVFFITNGQAYGKKLEYGSSTQAPYGIIRVTIAGMK